MNLDRDLADALRPLAGDPVADAARVLAALPAPPSPPPPPRPQRPWLPWTLLALGAAAGVAVGRALSPEPQVAEPPPVREAPQPPEKTPDNPSDKPDKPEKPPDKPADPRTMSEQEYLQTLQVMAFGPIEVDEPIDGVQHLEPGQWRARFGSLFRTGDSQAGVYVPGNDAQARFDRDTEARMGPELVELESGCAWICTGSRSAAVRVLCGPTMYAAMENGSCGMFTRSPSGTEVLSLRGTIVLHLETDTVALAKHESVIVDALGAGKKTKVPFTAPATSWMTQMIAQSLDPNELPERVEDVVAAFAKAEFRDEAELEIRRLGARSLWVLADNIERTLPRDRDHALRAADLLAQIVTYDSATYALPLLMQEDPDLRVIVFRGAQRVTGYKVTSEEFWRNESRDKRRLAVERWQKELKGR